MAFAESMGEEQQPYKYNGKELDRRLQLNTYDYAARYMDPAIGRFTSIDPHAENYYSISPYAYAVNNPLKYIDPDGRDPKNPEHWKRFAKEFGHAITFNLSVGFQAGAEVKTGIAAPVEVNVNMLSIDLVGVEEGEFYHPLSTDTKHGGDIKQEFSVGVGLVSVGREKADTRENGKSVTTDKFSVSIPTAEFTKVSTTDLDKKGNKTGTTREESVTRVPDVGGGVKAGVGVNLSLDVNKVWEALGRLLLDEDKTK